MISVLIYLLLGLMVGVLAGLFGVGGGIIVVPTLFWVFQKAGAIPYDHLMHVVTGTSLACMVISTFGSSWAHHKKGNVQWDVVRQVFPGTVIGAPVGILLAQAVSTQSLKRFFGCFLICMLIFMIRQSPKRNRVLPRTKRAYRTLGALIGVLAGTLGVGGAAFSVPVLLGMHFSMQQASATAAACIWPTAVIGALAALIAGLWAVDLPAGTVGFIYWPAALGVGIASLVSVSWGAQLSHYWPQRVTKRIFMVLCAFTAFSMLH